MMRNLVRLVAVLALLLAACGSGTNADTTDPVPTAPPTTTTPEPEPDPEEPATTTVVEAPSDAVGQAEAYWDAVASGDPSAVLELVDPTADPGAAVPFGRAGTMEGQFDWYRASDWRWESGGCMQGETDAIECTATAQNAWSEVLAVEPVTGTFVVEVGENGITAIIDKNDSFRSQWIPQVFEVFASWVDSNYPADASVMFNFAVDVNPEILGLYEVNTDRFVDAHGGG